MNTITFQGTKVEFDETKLKSWKIQRALADTGNPNGIFNATDEILCGKADEIAEKLGDNMDTMTELLKQIGEFIGGEAKNSPDSRQQFSVVAKK